MTLKPSLFYDDNAGQLGTTIIKEWRNVVFGCPPQDHYKIGSMSFVQIINLPMTPRAGLLYNTRYYFTTVTIFSSSFKVLT